MPRYLSMRISLCLICVSLIQCTANAQQAGSTAQIAKAIAPFVEDDTALVARLDLAALDAAKLYSLAESFASPEHPLLQTQTAVNRWLEEFRQAGGREVYVVVTLADLPEEPPFMIVPLGKQTDEKALRKLTGGSHVVERIGDTLFVGSTHSRERLANSIPAQRPELARAFAAIGDRQVQIAFIPSAASRRVVEELMPNLPVELGGGPVTTLSRGVLWAAIGGDLSPKPTLRLVVQSQTAEAARALRDYLTRLLRDRSPQLEKLLATLLPAAHDDRLTLSLDDRQIVSVAEALKPAINRLLASQRRRETTTNLMQIGLAMHNYSDRNKHFPPSSSNDVQGRPLLSWRVALLPYLDQDALFKEFHLDEPWDSEHNAKLIERMPAIFRSFGSTASVGRTCYLVPVGPGSVFEPKSEIEIRDITDGTSNTIMAVEVADQDAVVWTKPDDYVFDPKHPTAKLTTPYSDGRLILYCDGSAHLLPLSLDDEMLRRRFMRNDGQPVNP